MIYKIIIIFLVGFHGNRIYQMKEKVICYIIMYGCYVLFCSLKVLRFFKSVLLKFAEKSDGERVNELNYIHVLLLMLTIHVWPF